MFPGRRRQRRRCNHSHCAIKADVVAVVVVIVVTVDDDVVVAAGIVIVIVVVAAVMLILLLLMFVVVVAVDVAVAAVVVGLVFIRFGRCCICVASTILLAFAVLFARTHSFSVCCCC